MRTELLDPRHGFGIDHHQFPQVSTLHSLGYDIVRHHWRGTHGFLVDVEPTAALVLDIHRRHLLPRVSLAPRSWSESPSRALPSGGKNRCHLRALGQSKRGRAV